MVRVSPPSDPTGIQAEARAVLDKRQGYLTAIEIINPGSGYSSAIEPVIVEVYLTLTLALTLALRYSIA